MKVVAFEMVHKGDLVKYGNPIENHFFAPFLGIGFSASGFGNGVNLYASRGLIASDYNSSVIDFALTRDPDKSYPDSKFSNLQVFDSSLLRFVGMYALTLVGAVAEALVQRSFRSLESRVSFRFPSELHPSCFTHEQMICLSREYKNISLAEDPPSEPTDPFA